MLENANLQRDTVYTQKRLSESKCGIIQFLIQNFGKNNFCIKKLTN